MRIMAILVALLMMATMASWAADLVVEGGTDITAHVQQQLVASAVPNEIVVEGQTQLIVDWGRPLTSVERAFLATVPKGCDPSGQSLEGLIEACFRTVPPIAHAESAPYYGWKDGNDVVYDYSYYCRLLQPADASHRVRLRIPMPQIPAPLVLPPLQPCAPAQVAPVCVAPVKLELVPVCKEVCLPAPSCVAPSAPTGRAGAVAFGRGEQHWERTIGGFAVTPKGGPCEQESETCDKNGNPPPPPSTGEAGAGVDPGSGSQGPGQGSPGGYGSGGATLPAPPPGYGSTTPPMAGPPPPTTPGVGGGSTGGGDLVHPANN